ncbi:MAG: type II toxin-antitoxin system prevent-host-death family antitoxin [Terriglobales bacterium]|jgi:prevent-host-death family protein
MEKAISAADANRNFSQLLREVREGQSFVVTNHGRPVARLAPIPKGLTNGVDPRTRLLKRLRAQPIVKIGRWKRDELYE